MGLRLPNGEYMRLTGMGDGLASSARASFSTWNFRNSSFNSSIFGLQNAGNTSLSFGMQWFTNNSFYAITKDGTNWGYTAALNFTGWHHLAVVYDGGGATNADKVKAYVDGVERSLTFAGTVAATLPASFGNMSVGIVASSFGPAIYGESAYWSDTLTVPEIQSLANGASAENIRRASLYMHFPFSENYNVESVSRKALPIVGSTFSKFEDPPLLQKPRRKYFLFGDTSAPASVIFPNRTGSRARLIA